MYGAFWYRYHTAPSITPCDTQPHDDTRITNRPESRDESYNTFILYTNDSTLSLVYKATYEYV